MGEAFGIKAPEKKVKHSDNLVVSSLHSRASMSIQQLCLNHKLVESDV